MPVKIVMTLMVRDEADVIAAMIEHHRAQGIDHVLVTDNASVDGTTQILEAYASTGFVTLWHDPEHRKQQWSVVTRMARYAATDLGADWVINADADEFFVATDGVRTVRDVLASVDPEARYIIAPVINLTGAPARDGTGFGRLTYRDLRTDDELNAAGIPFHPTADAVHRGCADVEISQGNHFVSAPGWGEGVPTMDLEVLHLPWRSWRQYERKVRSAGSAYESNPELAPSPRHHGMQDYRRLQGGRLEATYVSKHPRDDEIEVMLETGSLQRDDRLRGYGAAGIAGVREDSVYAATELSELARRGRQFAALEYENEDRMLRLRREQDNEREIWSAARQRLVSLEQINEHLEIRVQELINELATLRRRRSVRLSERIRRLMTRHRRNDAHTG